MLLFLNSQNTSNVPPLLLPHIHASHTGSYWFCHSSCKDRIHHLCQCVLIGAPCLLHSSVACSHIVVVVGEKELCHFLLQAFLATFTAQSSPILPRPSSLCSCTSECHANPSARSDKQMWTNEPAAWICHFHQQHPASLFRMWIKN